MDDFVIVHHDKTFLWHCLGEMDNYLHERLKLKLNPKTDLFKVSRGFEFLGWRFFLNQQGQIVRRIKRQSKQRVKEGLKVINQWYQQVIRLFQMSNIVYQAIKGICAMDIHII